MRPAPKAHPCQSPGPQNPRPKILDATTHGPPNSQHPIPRPHGPRLPSTQLHGPRALSTRPHGPQTPDPMGPGHAPPRPTPPSIRVHGASVPEHPTPEHSTPRPHGPTAPKNPTRRSLAPECTVQARLTERPLPGTSTRPTKPRTQPTKRPPSFRPGPERARV